MSSWQVYKFGGSSLGAEGRLPVVLRRVAEARRPLALVVSALGDTTEWLLEAAGWLLVFGLLALHVARPIWDLDVFWQIAAGRASRIC